MRKETQRAKLSRHQVVWEKWGRLRFKKSEEWLGLGKLRQEDCYKFKPAWVTEQEHENLSKEEKRSQV